MKESEDFHLQERELSLLITMLIRQRPQEQYYYSIHDFELPKERSVSLFNHYGLLEMDITNP